MRTTCTIGLMILLMVSCFGFIRGEKGRHASVPEANQGLLKHHQTLQGVVGPVGDSKPLKPTAQKQKIESDTRAARIVASSAFVVAKSDASKQGSTPIEGATDLKTPIIAATIGFGAFFAFWLAGRRQQPAGSKLGSC